jgi:hypothetical protein
MEKYTPGNLVGHGNRLWEVRRHRALRRGKVRLRRTQVAQVSPMSCLCRLCRARRANVAFITLVSRCMHSTIDLTYIAIWAIVRLLRIESLHRETPKNSFGEAKKAAEHFLDACPLEVFRCFINHLWCFMSAYQKGLTGEAAAWAVRKQKQHHSVSQTVMDSIMAVLN